MKLGSVLKRLHALELRQLATGSYDEGEIQFENYPAVIMAINAAMLQLYTRFPLRMKEVVIQQYEHIFYYTLHSDYAQTNVASTEPYKYIIDYVPDPFSDDVIKLEAVYDEGGNEIKLNDQDEHYSFFTPEYNVLQIPYPDPNNAVTVVYRATPVEIPLSVIDSDYEVKLPPHMLEPLIAYVTHLIYASGNIGGHEDADKSLAKYLRLVEDIEKYGGINVDRATNIRLERNGWV